MKKNKVALAAEHLDEAERRVLALSREVQGMYEKNGDAMTALIEDLRPGAPAHVLMAAGQDLEKIEEFVSSLTLLELVRYSQLLRLMAEWSKVAEAAMTENTVDRAIAEVLAEADAAAAPAAR